MGFVLDYRAEALDATQPRQEERLAWMTLGCWLAQRTAYHVDGVAHFEMPPPSDTWIFRHSKGNPASVMLMRGERGSPLDEVGWREAARLAARLEALESGGAVLTAASALLTALGIVRWDLRYLTNWLAVEALFGAEDGREITYRLSQRVALFLEGANPTGKALSTQVRKDYGWRSKVVHGLRLGKLKDAQSRDLSHRIEEVNLRVFREILDGALESRFDGKEREEYLDGLVFEPRST